MRTIRARVLVLVSLALLPALAYTVWVYFPEGITHTLLGAGPALGLASVGVVAAVLAAHLSVVLPIKRLNRAVDHWRRGEGFDTTDLQGAPDEILALAWSFEEAARAIEARQAALARATEQQELLILEIHHRVKNNLQIVASLLNLQASRIRLPEAKEAFQAARDRVRALATLHRHLYADGGLHMINMRSFLGELCGQLFQAMGEIPGQRIALDIEAPELEMTSDQAVPLALIVTEAVTNAVKYAFPGQAAGRIGVCLKHQGSTAVLVIEDNGIGLPEGRAETETGVRDGIGLQLIRGFSRQLGATMTLTHPGSGMSGAGHGTRYVVDLPLRAATTGADQV